MKPQRRYRAFLLSLLVYLAGSAPLHAQQGTLLTANREGGSLSFVDLPSAVEIARIPIGPVIPHEVHVSPDGRSAVTTEYGSPGNPGRHLLLIDIASAAVVARIDLGADSRPHTARYLPDGRHVVATMENLDQVALVDLETGQVIKKFETGGREGHMVRVSPDGSRAYVTSRRGTGTLSVIFLEQQRDPVVIQTGPGAEGIAVTADGSEVWVANRGEDTISVIDTSSLEIKTTLPSRPYPGRIAMSPDGQYAIVPNGGFAAATPNYLRLYDANSHEVLGEIPLRDGSAQNALFGVLIRDNRVFVSDAMNGTVRVFSLPDLSLEQTLLQSHEAPDGLGWSPQRIEVMQAR